MSLLSRLVGAAAGTVGGLVATGAMTAVLAAATARGWLGTPPPKKIVDAATPPMSDAATNAAAAISHVAFGAGAGALYGLLGGHRRQPMPAAIATGVAYGLAVWVASYEGWVPAAGIMPPAHRDRPARTASMIVAHVVYGAVLGAWTRRSR
jgi:uncharacterized membrane protein YagU involved in acid resistance